MIEKKRLDTMVFERGIIDSRQKAKAIIMSGNVYVDNQKADKPGSMYKSDVKIEYRGRQLAYVSRGGLKLEKAINSFNINLESKICMDIGASTGGFTDCMLQNGAKKVYAVDVGYGQLAWKLRTDKRVINLERTNIRYLDDNKIGDRIDFCSVDVSFISLCIVLPVARKFLSDNKDAVCLIKPQFEAGKENVGKKGVIRDPLVHKEVIEKIKTFALSNGFSVLGLDFSPVKGPEGNIEYLIHIRRTKSSEDLSNIDIEDLVNKSHEILNGGD